MQHKYSVNETKRRKLKDKKYLQQTRGCTSDNILFDRNIRTLQVFILPFEYLEVLHGFLVRVLHFEELCAERSRLFLCPFQLGLTLLILLLPLRKDLGRT